MPTWCQSVGRNPPRVWEANSPISLGEFSAQPMAMPGRPARLGRRRRRHRIFAQIGDQLGAAVEFEDLFGNGQAEAGAAFIPGAAFLDVVEENDRVVHPPPRQADHAERQRVPVGLAVEYGFHEGPDLGQESIGIGAEAEEPRALEGKAALFFSFGEAAAIDIGDHLGAGFVFAKRDNRHFLVAQRVIGDDLLLLVVIPQRPDFAELLTIVPALQPGWYIDRFNQGFTKGPIPRR